MKKGVQNKNKYSNIKPTFRTRPYVLPKDYNTAIIKKANEDYYRLTIKGLEIVISTIFQKENNSPFSLSSKIINGKNIKIDDKEFQEILKNYSNFIIVDLRDRFDFSKCKIKGSINVPIELFKIDKIPNLLLQLVY